MEEAEFGVGLFGYNSLHFATRARDKHGASNKPSGDSFGSNRQSPTGGKMKRSPEKMLRLPRPGWHFPSQHLSYSQHGFFEIKGHMRVAADPDVTYGILTDYEKNPDIFKTVSKVEVEQNDKGKFVTQYAHWNLLFMSGTFDMKMKVEEDPSRKAVSYKLNEPGFLKMFNGYWDVEPRMVNGKSVGCNVVVKQEVLPSMLPPGPLASYVSRILGNQVKAVLQDLSVEAERVQQSKQFPAK